ncbi:MAG: alpha/beta family hydrolase [Amphritea sp.]
MIVTGTAKTGRILFAHGAGAPMDSEFMETVAQGLADGGLQVVRFEFPYMEKRREDGKKRPPDRQPKLLEVYIRMIEQWNKDDVPLFLAGKSMGGRMATMLCDQPSVAACFVYGYPFYAPGKQDRPRIEHLQSLLCPVHVFQGTRDRMGDFETVSAYGLSDALHLNWLEDGDHDLKPRIKSGLTQDAHIRHAVECTLQICHQISRGFTG